MWVVYRSFPTRAALRVLDGYGAGSRCRYPPLHFPDGASAQFREIPVRSRDLSLRRGLVRTAALSLFQGPHPRATSMSRDELDSMSDFAFFANFPWLLLTNTRQPRRAVPTWRVGASIAPASADAFLARCLRRADPQIPISTRFARRRPPPARRDRPERARSQGPAGRRSRECDRRRLAPSSASRSTACATISGASSPSSARRRGARRSGGRASSGCFQQTTEHVGVVHVPRRFRTATSPHACQKGLLASVRLIPMSASRWSLSPRSSRRVLARKYQVRTVEMTRATASSSLVPPSACARWGR